MMNQWYCQRQVGAIIMDSDDVIHENGRHFRISQYWTMNLAGDLGYSGPFFEIEEQSVFSHEPHGRRVKRNLRSMRAVEMFVERFANLPFDRMAEEHDARTNRLKWLERHLLRCESRLKRDRGYLKRGIKSGTPHWSGEQGARRAERVEGQNKEVKQLRKELRRTKKEHGTK